MQVERIAFAGSVVLVLLGVPSAAWSDEPPAGKRIFVESKCGACHSISSEGLKADEVSAGEAEDKDAPAPPDLSDLGSRRKAAFIDQYLLKKETIEGRKHKKSFKGSDADRQALVNWLSTLTAKPAAPAAPAAPGK